MRVGSSHMLRVDVTQAGVSVGAIVNRRQMLSGCLLRALHVLAWIALAVQ